MLCKPGSVKMKNSFWVIIHLGNQLPNCSCNLPEDKLSSLQSSYLVLLQMGFVMPFLLPKMRWALNQHKLIIKDSPFHPYQYGGIFSVTLSITSRCPAVNRHLAQWSPDFPLLFYIINSDYPNIFLIRLYYVESTFFSFHLTI